MSIRKTTSAILLLRGGRFEFVVFEFVIVDYCGSVESEIVPGAALHPRLYSAACDSGLRSTRVWVPPFSVAMSSGVHCDMFDEPSLADQFRALGFQFDSRIKHQRFCAAREQIFGAGDACGTGTDDTMHIHITASYRVTLGSGI